MKSLSQHISEKLIINQRFDERLIINKNYKNVDDIETLFNNVKFEQRKQYNAIFFVTSDNIFSMMIDYIRVHNIKSFSDFDSYKKKAIKGRDACFAAFNKRIKDMNIFQKMPDGTYINFRIFKRSLAELYHFERYELYLESVDALQNNKKWNNVDDVEYYEISEETFGDIAKLYDELIEK